MVWVGGCGDGRGAASGPREGVPAGTVPGVGLDPEDEVDAVDLAVAAGGALHVTWREVDRRPDGSGLPSYRAVHAVKEAGAWGRSSPEVLPLRHRPRLVAAGTSLHLVAGPRLEHLRREEDGGWRVLDPLTEPDRPPVLAFDLAAAGGEVAAACTSRLPDGSAFALYLLSSEGAPSRQLAQLPSSVFDQPAPRLLIDGKRLDLLWAVNGERRRILTRGGRTTEEITPRAGVFYLRSDDGGATWRPPAEVTAGLPEPPSTVDSVELVRDGRGILALYASFGLYASRSSDG